MKIGEIKTINGIEVVKVREKDPDTCLGCIFITGCTDSKECVRDEKGIFVEVDKAAYIGLTKKEYDKLYSQIHVLRMLLKQSDATIDELNAAAECHGILRRKSDNPFDLTKQF